jgi:hypothetical protein
MPLDGAMACTDEGDTAFDCAASVNPGASVNVVLDKPGPQVPAYTVGGLEVIPDPTTCPTVEGLAHALVEAWKAGDLASQHTACVRPSVVRSFQQVTPASDAALQPCQTGGVGVGPAATDCAVINGSATLFLVLEQISDGASGWTAIGLSRG